MSMITKMFLFIMITSIFFVTIAINLIIDSERKTLINVLKNKQIHYEEIYSDSLSPLLFDLNEHHIETTLKSLYNDRDIAEIELKDYSDIINIKINSKKYIKENSIKSTLLLQSNGMKLGELTIIYTKEHIETMLQHFQEKIIIGSSLLVFILLMIILYYMNYVTKSLTILSTATKEIADGNLDYPIDITTNDEIGELSKRFRYMRDSLKERIEIINKQLTFQQDLIDNVNTPIYYKGIDKKYRVCNKAFEELLQIPKSEIIDKTVLHLINDDTAKYYTKKDDELFQNHEPQEYEGELTQKDGSIKDLVFYKNIFYEDGIASGLIGAIFDITERKSLNYELKRLLSSFDKNVIASKTDINGTLIYVSEAFCNISGYEQNELIGKKHSVVKGISTKKSLYKDLWTTIKAKHTWTGEIEDQNKNGETYTLKTIITPEYDINGKFLNYVAISQNITAQKDIEKANIKIDLLNKDIIDTQKEILFRLGAIAESRSKETGMHVKRVAEYSKLLATIYGLSKEEIEIVKMASPMHDIGKIAIPDAILNKPGKYNQEEFEIMKKHAQIGYDMLKDSDKPILKAAAIIAYHHQEKYDGSGYPQQLKGNDIHIYGRITAVADVFDALGSKRVYKKAWTDEEMFKLLKNESGKHFDPVLIEIFFNNLDEFLKIRDSFKDIK